jgi:hypothetical protein
MLVEVQGSRSVYAIRVAEGSVRATSHGASVQALLKHGANFGGQTSIMWYYTCQRSGTNRDDDAAEE